MDLPKRYRGFVSYSRADESRARRLHRALESYRVPSGIACDGLAPGRRLGRFFLDDEESAAARSLDPFLRGALEESTNLVVVCSPPSARSEWVEKEVGYYSSKGGGKVLAVIVAGEPHAKDPARECYTPTLRALDPAGVRWKGNPFARVRAKVVAELLDIPFDTLWDRDRRRRARWRLLGACAGVLAAVALAWSFLLVSDRQLAARLAVQALELLERRQFRLEGKYGTNESLIGARQYREALPIAMASLPRASDLVPYDGPLMDCGSFGRIPACRCAGLRVAYAVPRAVATLPIALGFSGKLVSDEGGDRMLVAAEGTLHHLERAGGTIKQDLVMTRLWGPWDASGGVVALADGQRPGFVRIHDAARGEALFESRVFDASIVGLSFAVGGSELAALGNRGEVARLVRRGDGGASWSSVRTPGLVEEGGLGAAPVHAPDGALLVAAGPPARLHRLTKGGGWAGPIALGFDETPRLVKASRSGRYAAVAGESRVALVDLDRVAPTLLPYRHAQTVSALDFSPDGRLLLSASFDNNVVVWDIGEGRIETVFSHGWHVQDARFLDDGRRIMASTHQGDVWVWDLATRSELLRVNGTGQALPILDPDHGRFLARPEGGEVTLFELRDLAGLSSGQIRERLAADLPESVDFATLHADYGLGGWPRDLRSWEGLGRRDGWVQAGRRFLALCGLLGDAR